MELPTYVKIIILKGSLYKCCFINMTNYLVKKQVKMQKYIKICSNYKYSKYAKICKVKY